ncbi:MAG TPA: tripartite tricarboxylate transporter substrate binding protein [Burkholderiales bacterium]|nr:tripartite tricarboxylate transporter substrate binding protein [Burkholderiales bacterium]
MGFLCLLLAALTLTAAQAQSYPTKPVRVIVAFSPGGVTDIIARTLMPKLSEMWGQPVVIENRTGAGGTLGAMVVARAPADGSVLLVHSSGYAINAAIQAALPYDPRRDFVDVAPLGSQPQVLVVNPASGLRSVRDVIARAKAKPGDLSYGSAGIGSGGHFNAEMFRIAAGIEVLHIPYKGGVDAINDTAAGRLDFTFNTLTLALPYIRDARVVVLGVSSAKRTSLLPEVPTIAESGVPGFEFTFWNGLWAPAGTPAPIAEKIARDLAQVMGASDVRERFARLGAEPMAMTPPEFSRFVRAEIENAERIARISGIKAQ